MRYFVLLINGIVLLTMSNSCTSSQIDLPKPARAIEGTYQAVTFIGKDTLAYPIQNQTIIVKIEAISSDSVRVERLSTLNGIYSPGTSEVYDKLNVQQNISTVASNKRCVSYELKLMNVTNNILKTDCDNTNTLDYIYTPVGSQTSYLCRLRKL